MPNPCPVCGGDWLDLPRHLLFAHGEELVLDLTIPDGWDGTEWLP
jgi:hypothetical protein